MAPPTLLLTRPAESAQAFLANLDQGALARVRVVVAPLMEISGTGNTVQVSEKQSVIFTSANGVSYAPEGAGRIAYCVGTQTTQKAISRGWNAQQAGDTAQDLIVRLQADPPKGPLLHLAGVHTRGDIAQNLSDVGTPTTHIALYSQSLLPLSMEAKQALLGRCIVPVFSPRSAAQLVKEANGNLRNSHIIALSEAVAAVFPRESTGSMLVLSAPQAVYMRKAVENLCKTLGLP